MRVKGMRVKGITLLALFLVTSVAIAEVKPETIGISKMKAPEATWFFVKSTFGPAYIFDSATGDMHGLISLSTFSPAVEPNLSRGEIYSAGSYYSRGNRGDRTDVVDIFDVESLAPIDEIKIPTKVAAALPFRHYIGLMDDKKHLAVFNMTPASSVSIVDIDKRKFVVEISTPGCALIMPSENRSFLQICGDGTLQQIRLDKKGNEQDRIRSEVFFNVDEDPVFDKPVPTPDGWLLLSYKGNIREASVAGKKVTVTDPWSILSEEDKSGNWQTGGGQLMAYHAGLNLIFAVMHQGEPDTHEDPGNEVWIFDRATQRRIARLKLTTSGSNLLVSQTEEPLLTVTGVDGQLHVYDVKKMKLVRSINHVGGPAGLLQGV